MTSRESSLDQIAIAREWLDRAEREIRRGGPSTAAAFAMLQSALAHTGDALAATSSAITEFRMKGG